MERPMKYELHTTMSYVANIGNETATKKQLIEWSIEAKKMLDYINYLEECASQNSSTSDEALPIGDVVVCDHQLAERGYHGDKYSVCIKCRKEFH
jgi:hypothetical protein